MRLVTLVALVMLAGAGRADVPAAWNKSAGAPVARIMIEVFSDFQCPSCKVFHENNLRALMADYVNPGKVYLVFREFPLPIHAHAKAASAWACAAARLGKYPAVSDALFAKQAAWSADGKVEDAACSVLSPAEAKKAKALVSDPSIAAEIDRETREGQSAGVNSTPTLLITHQLKRYPVSANTNYNLLRRLLDDLLAK